MSKAKPSKPREQQPTMGGLYSRDPATGKLSRIPEPIEQDEPASEPVPAAAPEDKEA